MPTPNRAGPPPVQNRALPAVVGKYDEVVKAIQDRHSQFTDLLGAKYVDRWQAVALHALAQNKNVLRDCTPFSIIEAIRESATLGLSPTGSLGEGWILPYGDQAKFMPGYRGLLKLLRNSGQVRIADTQIVYMNDDFVPVLGTSPSIHHVPVLYGEKNADGDYIAERGDYRGAYAWVRLTNGETLIEWMTLDDLMKVRQRSRAKDDGPWVTDPGEMMRKTPLRRLLKRLPLESMPQVARAAVLDEEADVVIEGEATEVQPVSARATAAAYAVGRGATDEASDDPEPSGSVPEASALCGLAGPDADYGPCVGPAGHDGLHRDAEGQTWASPG